MILRDTLYGKRSFIGKCKASLIHTMPSMRRIDSPNRSHLVGVATVIAVTLFCVMGVSHGFSSIGTKYRLQRAFVQTRTAAFVQSSTALQAKKKKTPAAAALEKLEALDALVEEEDDGGQALSRKELLKLQKEQSKGGKKAEAVNTADPAASQKILSTKEEMLLKALHMEQRDEQRNVEGVNGSAALSKKVLNDLKKKEEKIAAKLEKKKPKKTLSADSDELHTPNSAQVNGSASVVITTETVEVEGTPQETGPTLEDKIRKERPPPRVRVMETSQPGYTSLRLENVGVTFRNQEVLKEVTWGVQTGDRIGLVGANGAGKTTQIRILAGELEPTTGDVVKSSQDLRVAVLRQEFVDELVAERTLQEEFLSVFGEEMKILEDIRAAEIELENTQAENSAKMQEILDRMQDLQNNAENKGVYALESRVKKVMDLMGFSDDEGDDLVASFSGGWKMRIGLGKVLLKDPNILLLDEVSSYVEMIDT